MSRKGASMYHCYHLPHIWDMDSFLALDAANGMESAAIMWGSASPPTPLLTFHFHLCWQCSLPVCGKDVMCSHHRALP